MEVLLSQILSLITKEFILKLINTPVSLLFNGILLFFSLIIFYSICRDEFILCIKRQRKTTKSLVRLALMLIWVAIISSWAYIFGDCPMLGYGLSLGVITGRKIKEEQVYEIATKLHKQK